MVIMYTQKKSIDNTHIVRERDRRRFRELLAVLSLGIPIGLFLLLFTWQNLEVIRLAREANRLQQRRKDIEDSNKTLRLELDRLTALDAVERKAASLGFATTEPLAIVTVSAGADAGAAPVSPREAATAAAGVVQPAANPDAAAQPAALAVSQVEGHR